MNWNDLIQLIMRGNNGIASLNFLYQRAANYRKLPSGDWQKTLRGVLYREVRRGRLKKVGLGVYALSSYNNETAAYSYALRNRPVSEYMKGIKDYHSTIEGMLIEIGNFFEYVTYTSDLKKGFDGKKLGELCAIANVPEFTYPELTALISKSDTIWFSKSRLIFPKYIFEVESTTNFTNSLLKMYQLLNFDAKFILVGADERINMFKNRIAKEPFVKEAHRFSFRSFRSVMELYFSSVEHYELKSRFLS